MTARLTPALALRYLQELSADVRAGVVLDRDGTAVAGDPALTAAAQRLVAAAGDRRTVCAPARDGWACVARGAAHSIVLACGSHALPGLLEHDLAAVLEDLGDVDEVPSDGPAPPASVGSRQRLSAPQQGVEPLSAAAEALLSASQRGSVI